LAVSSSARKLVTKTVKAVVGDKSKNSTTEIPADDSSTDNISKEQNRINELITKNQEDLLQKLKEIESRTGIPQPIDKIKDTQKLTKEEITKLIQEASTASPERRQEIIDEITNKIKKEQEEADRILKEERNKLEKMKNQSLLEAQEEQNNNGNSARAKSLYSDAEKQAQTINQQNKLIAELQKKAKEREETAKKLVNDAGKTSWYQTWDFSS
jgi:Ni,Fe-hydrogenase I large subunit